METVPFNEDGADENGVSRRSLSAALGTTDVAINHYRLEPGTGLPGGLHAHVDQEELFVVLAGTATFDTLDGPVDVAGGEAIRFAPGEFQSGRNDGSEVVELLALGAPRDSEDVRIPVTCPDCGHDDLRLDTDGALTFVCPDCDIERVPSPCPDCGEDDLRITLGDETETGAKKETETVVVCQHCEARFETPPMEE